MLIAGVLWSVSIYGGKSVAAVGSENVTEIVLFVLLLGGISSIKAMLNAVVLAASIGWCIWVLTIHQEVQIWGIVKQFLLRFVNEEFRVMYVVTSMLYSICGAIWFSMDDTQIGRVISNQFFE